MKSKPDTAIGFLRLVASVEAHQREAFVTLCWEEDTLGVEEFSDSGTVSLVAYFPGSRSPGVLLRALQSKSRRLGFEIERLEVESVQSDPDEWLARWRDGFTGFPVGESFFVHPPWEPASPSHRVNLEIEPGHAFGTGTHESTQLCLLALEELTNPPGSLLDVGTGSGILAIGAARLFLQASIIALDIDPQAVDAARQNLMRNASRRVCLLVGGTDAIRSRFDLVLANLTLPIFRKVARDLIGLAHRDLIVSGFTEEQGPEVLDLFERQGARLLYRRALRGWLCLQLTRSR